MAEIEEFSRRMFLIGAKLEERIDARVRRVALAADQAVVMATPVDTGRARANWQVRVGTPAEGTLESFPEGAGSSAQFAIDHARETLARNEGFVHEIHITNNLPYINRLNDGYSAQAPAGFVEAAVKAAAVAVGEGDALIVPPSSGV